MQTTANITNSFIESGMLPVMEMFYTIQGEGYHTGTAAFFIRLAGCDVGCVWCDVKESWAVEEAQYVPVNFILEEALKHPGRVVVITGGEPCMYDLTELISKLKNAGFKSHIETSGAYPLIGNPDWVCVSPKKFKGPLPEMLKLADELKVVIFNNSDFQWAETHAGLVNLNCKLFLQPEFGKSNSLLPGLVAHTKQFPKWRISLQTHKFIGIP